MRLSLIVAGVSFAVLAATSVVTFAADDAAKPQPYLAASDEPDATKFLPAFPAKGSRAKAEDQFVFDSWRKKSKDPRWTQAVADADWHADVTLAGFGCALGVKLDASNAPKLLNVLERLDEDLNVAASTSKKYFHRNRPFVGTKKLTCMPRSSVGDSFSYPSGHSSLGWSFALVLSELAPDRASGIMARGRAYGESRAVCGMHWESDVEAGRYVGAAVVAALHSNVQFRADMDAARAEVAAARTSVGATSGPTCDLQNASDAKRPW